jgi:DNA-binding NarL/FixJ family response regulator
MDDQTITVLLIEDDPDDAFLIQEMLSEAKGVSFEIEHEERLDEGLARLAKGGLDAVLVDLGLPDSLGMETFLRVQAHAPEVPVLVLTGLDDEAVGLRAVRRGAQDYLVKGNVNSEVLSSAVLYAVQRKRLEETAKRKEYFIERIVNKVPDILYVYDLTEHRITYVNERMFKTFGITSRKLMKMGPDDLKGLVRSEDLGRVRQAFAELKQAPDDRVVELEFQAKGADDGWRRLRTRNIVFERDADGAATKSLGTAQVVT